MTKGKRINGTATILRTYTSIVGSMAWYTPHVVFDLDGQQYLWRPELESWLGREGARVTLSAFAYDRPNAIPTLRRVKATLLKETL